MLTLRITSETFKTDVIQPTINSMVVSDVRDFSITNHEYALCLVIDEYALTNEGEPRFRFVPDVRRIQEDGTLNPYSNIPLETASPIDLLSWKEHMTSFLDTGRIFELYQSWKNFEQSTNCTEDEWKQAREAENYLNSIGKTAIKYIVVTFSNGDTESYYTRQIDPVYVMNESGKTIDKL